VARRGDIYLARLDPFEGSEQAGQRPVVVMSRDSINEHSSVIVAVPVTDKANKKTIYPSHTVLREGEGGLTKDSVALGEQVRAISSTRLLRYMGRLPASSVSAIADALKIVLDL
jgi:mRNA interferase MazF